LEKFQGCAKGPRVSNTQGLRIVTLAAVKG
jgi:hypothetical protein